MDFRAELRSVLSIAGPVIVAELGWVTMGLVDTLMVGGLGPEAIGAVGIGSALFVAVAVFAMGLLLGLDPLVAEAFGASRLDECHHWLVAGVWLALLASAPVIAVMFLLVALLPYLGLPPEVLALAPSYLSIVSWSLPPLLLYVAFRRYLQAMNVVSAVTYTLIAANIVNAIVNYLLITGRFGAPALGVRGAAYATLLSRVVMAAALLIVIIRREAHTVPPLKETPFALDMARVRRLVKLGLPAGGQMLLEVGVFASATALAGRVSATSLAAHQIAINLAALTFMIPFGLSSAAAVRVGQALGRKDPRAAISAGWIAIALGVSFMAVAAVVFLLMPEMLIRAFTDDRGVIDLGVRLLFVAAVFQLFDGLQGVTTGALRGLSDTHTAMLWSLGGHWFVGLPLGYLLCFTCGYGVVGLWWGLSAGLMICGVSLITVWWRKGKRLSR